MIPFVYIRSMKKFVSVVQKFDSPLWGFHTEVPHDIAMLFIDGDNRRVRCTLNEKVKTRSALMPPRQGWFLLINKSIREELDLQIGSEVSITLEKDHSAYGMAMPEELEVMLNQDDAGNGYFHALTPGKQRSLIYIVSQVKNVDSRIRKSLAILDHLKEEKGALDFKRLNTKIKEYNQQAKLKR